MGRVIFLGSTGKLGRALQRVWSASPPEGLEPLWLGRKALETQSRLPRAQAVVALWGVTHGPAQALAQNVPLAEAARVLAKASGAERVLHLSSAAVYGACAKADPSEAAPLAPLGAYGQAKADMEARIALFGPRPRNCVLRLGNVAGCDSLFRTLAEGRVAEIDQFESGKGPQRSYISVPQFGRVLEALLALPLAELPDVLNVAQPGVAEMGAIAAAAGAPVCWRPAPAGALARVALDVRALQRIVGLPEVTPEALVESWRCWGGWA